MMAPTKPNTNLPKDKNRLVYFDYFRGLAILIIILGHCYNAWPRNQMWEATLVNLISGGTALFVFISGFFFHHVYYPKYQYWSFIKNKAKYVFAPYIILSLLYIGYYYLLHGEVVMANVLNEYFGPQLNNIALVLLNLLTGRTLWAYWYIPFIMMVFLLSPVFIRFIRLPLIVKIIITTSLLIISMIVHRPSWELNPFHSLIYYVPFYLLGMIYSLHRPIIDPWIQGKAPLLFIVTVTVAAGMHLLGQTDNMGKASIFAWHGIDLMVIQKLSLIPFMLAFTMALQQYKIGFLNTMASMSFALYFLHQWALSFMRSTGVMDFAHGFGGVLYLFALAVIIAYLIARCIKLLLSKQSRFVIGW